MLHCNIGPKIGLQDPQGGVLPYGRDASNPRHERRKLPGTLSHGSQSQRGGLAVFPQLKASEEKKRAVGKPRPISFEGMNLQRGTVVAAELGGNRHVHQLYAW